MRWWSRRMLEGNTYEKDHLSRFVKLIKDDSYDPLNYWYPKVNPAIKGLKRARMITLLCLVSGEFGINFRDRINILFLGKPGTGKTGIRDFLIYEVDEYSEHPYMGTGSGTKRAALTYNANRDEVGMLNKTNNGVLAVDELDEVDRDDRGSLLEAMSEGKYEVTKGKYSDGKKFEANTRVIGTANSTDGFRPEFLDRWDFVINFEKPDSKSEDRIIEHTFSNAYLDTEETGMELADYIKFVRQHTPEPVDMDRNIQLASNLIKVLRNKVDDEKEYRRKYSDVRKKQSLLRTALSIARLNYQQQKEEHFLESIMLHYPILTQEELQALVE